MKFTIITFIIAVLGLNSCSTPQYSLMSSLEREVNLSSDKVSYSTLKVERFEISTPILSNAKFNSELKALIAKDTSVLDCIGDIKVNYRVNAKSNNFLSLTKEVEMLFCENYPSDIVYSETLNYLINNDSLYLVSLRSENSFSDEILSKNQGEPCTGEFVDSKSKLYFKPSEMRVLVWFDKTCSYSVQVPINKSEIVFRSMENE